MKKLILALILLCVPAVAQRIGADQVDIPASAPGNPPTGKVRLYSDGDLKCKKSDGSSCMPTGGGTLTNEFTFYPTYGVCDGTTDDTTALNNAMAAIYAAGGGKLIFPAGRMCKFTGQVLLPNNNTNISGSFPESAQPPYVWDCSAGTGSQYSATTFLVSNTTYGCQLDFTYNGAGNAKIVTTGFGWFTIQNLIFKDTTAAASATVPFFLTTATAIQARNNTFMNTSCSGTSCLLDVFILGGTNTSPAAVNDQTSAYQGYGTRIENNFFERVRHGVVCNAYCESVKFTGNHMGWATGSSTSDDAFLIFDGTSGQNGYHTITGNRFELNAMPYAMKFVSSVGSVINGNDVEDGTAGLGVAYFDANSSANFLLLNARSSIPAQGRFTDLSGGNNTIIDTTQNGISYFLTVQGQNVKGTSSVAMKPLGGNVATGANNYPSAPLEWRSSYWNGSAAAEDVMNCQTTVAAGTNPAVNVVCDNPSGSSGLHNWYFKQRVFFGSASNSSIDASGNFNSGGSITATGGNIQASDNDVITRALTAATGGGNVNSPAIRWRGNFWNGSASTLDTWTCQVVAGSGSNPTETLTCSHSGSTGFASVSMPALKVPILMSGTNGNTDLSGTIAVTASTTGTYSFSRTYAHAPVCVLTPTSDPTATGVYWATATTTVLTANVKTSGTMTFNYLCSGLD